MADNTDQTIRPLYRDIASGHLAQAQTDAVLAVGGIQSANFTINGTPVLLADGSSSGGNFLPEFDLQGTYNNTGSPEHSRAIVNLDFDKGLLLQDQASGLSFDLDPTGGSLTVNGDFLVAGSRVQFATAQADFNAIRVLPSTTSVPSLQITVNDDTDPTTNVIEVINGPTANVTFHVDPQGFTHASGIVSTAIEMLDEGRINGIKTLNNLPVEGLFSGFETHLNGTENRHTLAHINLGIDLPFLGKTADQTLDSALETLDLQQSNDASRLDQLDSQVTTVEGKIDAIVSGEKNVPAGFTFIQSEPNLEWLVTHNKNTTDFIAVYMDSSGCQFLPDEVEAIDPNTIVIRLTRPDSGRANILFYMPESL